MPKSDKPRLHRVVREISGQCLGVRARLVDRVISGIFDEHLRPLGLRNTQVSLLTAVGHAGEVGPGTLSEALSMEKSTVSRTVDRMIERGWLETLAVDDGRSYHVQLTPDGEAKLLEAHPAWRAAQRQIEALLGDELGRGLAAVAGRVNPRYAS